MAFSNSWLRGADERHLPVAVLVGLTIILTGVVIGLNQVSAWFSPVLFLCALGGVIYCGWRQGVGEQETKRTEDYTKFSSTDFAEREQWLKMNVRGQDEAIETVVSSLTSEMTIARPGQLLGAFLLVGPTGTGKTFLSQLIGQALYPDSEPVILRMNQYKSQNDVQTLLGPPPGMPGYEVGGALTRPVLQNPRRVIVLDELEKAHPDIHHCLYDILDAASCREKSSGKEVDFSLTTNATLLKPDIIEFLADERVGVTISIDGPKEVQDKFRVFHNGTGSYDVVAIMDAPDEMTVTALELSLAQAGNVRTQTMRGFSADEMGKILERVK